MMICGSISTIKRDGTTGQPVPGATYTLSQNGQVIASSTSDVCGCISFCNLCPGEYGMEESEVPYGYEADNQVHHVVVDNRGNVVIDGINEKYFLLYDMPTGSPTVDGTLIFSKVDASTGLPLEGGVFVLSNGATATSDNNGRVDFGSLEPGAYILTEVQEPDGYRPDSNSHTVVVTDDGMVTIDGIEADNFAVANERSLDLSPRPVISSISAGDTVITGEGEPGAELVVTLPDGTQLNTVADENGLWSVPVEDGLLQAGQTIYAHQTVPGYAPSEEASFLVQPDMAS